MLRTRIIPALLLRHSSLVKTVRFNKFTYIGDPCNTVRIFNELEVDELLFLDIMASVEGTGPNYELLEDIASECFMPLSYGGGIRSLEDAKRIFGIGFEKISLNSAAIENPNLITEIADIYGSQATIVAIDVANDILNKRSVRYASGKRRCPKTPIEWAVEAENRGAGEILLTSITREGTWMGFDLDLVRDVAESVSIPVIAHGGCGSITDIKNVVIDGGASAVALGNLVVFQKKGMGVLVNYPDTDRIQAEINSMSNVRL